MNLSLEAPEGAVLEFALLFGVVLLGPVLVRRARIPGIIGLLLGGFLIGPHGLGLIESGNHTIPELGQLGLLYLMFVAGLELDLRLLGAYRRAAITFGVMTFLVPFAGGTAVGFQQGWTTGAALLLGSLLASHTLILYPTIRDAGRAANPAVATAVGATVLTDTLALIVLAGVSGTATGEGSTASVLAKVLLGVVVLVVVAAFVLPRVASAALGLWGGDRAARYLVAVLSFLLMAVLAEVFSIEGIVGAFFAGIALNRLVPNEGPSMERIEFFGSAVFVPVFLVSVGLLLDPSVMFTTETMGIAALLIVACVGGKAVAAVLARPLLHFSAAEAGVMFVLTTPQAAATLAATIVGFEIGLFGTSVVNAVLVLILVSILVSTLLADRYADRLDVGSSGSEVLGSRVMLATDPDGPTPGSIAVARAIALADSGLVEVVVVHDEDTPPPSATVLRDIERRVFNSALEGSVRTVVDRDAAEAVAHAALMVQPSAAVIDDGLRPPSGGAEPLRRLVRVPVIAVCGSARTVPTGVTIVDGSEGPDAVLADELVRRLSAGTGGSISTAARGDGDRVSGFVVRAVSDWGALDGLRAAEGSIVLATLTPAARPDSADAI